MVQEVQIESIFIDLRGLRRLRRMASTDTHDHILHGIDTSGITTTINFQQILPTLWVVLARQYSGQASNP